SRWWPQAERSDHGPFTRHGVRAVHFYNRGNDGDWIDLAYHSARDVPARLHRDSLAETARLLRALVATSPPAHSGDGFWLPLARNTVVPRWTLIVGESVLILVVLVALVLSREGLVAALARRSQRATTPPASGLLAGAGCYVLAIVFSTVFERSFASGHPAPWLHEPLRALVGTMLVLLGALGLATRVAARIRPWCGGQRYRALAAITCTLIGAALLVVGAAELAWVWLVPAAVIAVIPARAAVIAVLASALPIACVMNPWQLREAAWNGFLPLSLPLSVLLGILAVPTIATLAWWLRRRTPSGPLGTLVLGMGCGLAVIIGLAFAATSRPACSPAKFETFHLACERV
ncbi:MAG TPA: M28 family peptidase, partial [Kofleriaceae bacterium]|nr:M28 family peptidase [Kofleriaceae bacterium]